MGRKIPVAVLGPSGLVGQVALKLLAEHETFSIGECVASERRQGEIYSDSVQWQIGGEAPRELSEIRFSRLEDIESPYVLSCLPASVAASYETYLCEKGHHVSSNASANRMQPEVPLLISDINPTCLDLIRRQQMKGKLVTNPNCATVMLSYGLFALLNFVEVNSLSVTTLQAASGAGFPGVSSVELLGNTIPHISGEEEKIIAEPKKIFEAYGGAEWDISAQVHRVPVLSGHSVSVEAECAQELSAKSWESQLMESEFSHLSFESSSGFPQVRKQLKPLDPNVYLGQIKQGVSKRHVRFTAMGDNLTRGAAVSAIENLERLHGLLSMDGPS